MAISRNSSVLVITFATCEDTHGQYMGSTAVSWRSLNYLYKTGHPREATTLTMFSLPHAA
jgi:hypothetical protein